MVCPYCRIKPLSKHGHPPKTCGDKVCQRMNHQVLIKKHNNSKPRRIKAREYARTPKEKKRRAIYMREWQQSERGKQWSKDYNRTEKRMAYQRDWQRNERKNKVGFKEQKNAYMRMWFLRTGQWHVRGQKHQYRKLLGQFWEAQGGKCNICKTIPKDTKHATIDHIYPVSLALKKSWPKEKINDTSNLQMLCLSCNSKKGNKVYPL